MSVIVNNETVKQMDELKQNKKQQNTRFQEHSYVNNNRESQINVLDDPEKIDQKARQRLKAHDKSSVLEKQLLSESSSLVSDSKSSVTASTPKRRFKSVHRSPRTISQKRMSSLAWKQNTPETLTSTFDDSVFYSQTYEEVLQTTRGLCRDYICYRLKRSGFQGRVVITKYAPAKDQNLSFDILKIGKTFEDLYPHLFRNLARQLGYVLRSDQELRSLFDRLATTIIGTNPDEYRWGRVLALMAIAGSLSVDCIAQGHTELIENMVTIFCDFVEVNLLTWIIEHGGWAEMAKMFGEKEDKNRERFNLFISNLSTAFVPVGWASVVLAGTALVLGGISRLY